MLKVYSCRADTVGENVLHLADTQTEHWHYTLLNTALTVHKHIPAFTRAIRCKCDSGKTILRALQYSVFLNSIQHAAVKTKHDPSYFICFFILNVHHKCYF